MGTITRDDGGTQVTYNGWPLYYYAPDVKPGDAKGQNSGDIWFVVSTHGGPIQTNAKLETSDHPELGTVIADASGRTLYLFTDDERDKSTCTRGCALAWPPLLTVGDPTAEEGVIADRLSSITREDSYTQVTYNGRPLYYFAPDQKPGRRAGPERGRGMVRHLRRWRGGNLTGAYARHHGRDGRPPHANSGACRSRPVKWCKSTSSC